MDGAAGGRGRASRGSGAPATRRAPRPAVSGHAAESPHGQPFEPTGTVTRMRDIAAIAGVSRSTVSRVLNDTPTRIPIAADTRARVMEAARRLGYRPNPLARGLRGAATMLLGVIVRDFSDPFFADAIEALAVETMAHGYNIVLGHAHGQPDDSVALTEVLETRHCDAIVLLGTLQDHARLLADLRGSGLPVVGLWQGTSPVEFPTVNVDDRAGTLIGLRHLADLGHEHIAFVSARLPGDNTLREDAYAEHMGTRLGGVPEGYLQRVPNTLAGGEDALRALLALPDPPTAIAASTDLAAVGVLRAAYNLGRAVPRELSVVGFDDLDLAAHTVPALTTLRMPVAEIVGEGTRIAIELARDPGAPRDARVMVFEPSLVVRESTAPPRTPARSAAPTLRAER